MPRWCSHPTAFYRIRLQFLFGEMILCKFLEIEGDVCLSLGLRVGNLAEGACLGTLFEVEHVGVIFAGLACVHRFLRAGEHG